MFTIHWRRNKIDPPWTDLYLTTTRTTKKRLVNNFAYLPLPTPLFAARRGVHDSVFASTSLKRVRKLHITMINGPRNIRKNQGQGKKKKEKEMKGMIIPSAPPPNPNQTEIMYSSSTPLPGQRVTSISQWFHSIPSPPGMSSSTHLS